MRKAILQALGFVAVNTALTAAFAALLCRILPPLEGAPPGLLLVPLTILAVPSSLALHLVVRRLSSSTHRGLALWGAFVAMMLGYGSWFGLHQPTHGARETLFAVLMTWPAALMFGHWFGAPAFLVFGAMNKLLSPWLTPRSSVS